MTVVLPIVSMNDRYRYGDPAQGSPAYILSAYKQRFREQTESLFLYPRYNTAVKHCVLSIIKQYLQEGANQ